MSWLIALALFWWIGSSIAKGIDKANLNNARKCVDQVQSYEIFLKNLYVAAWPYYQELEKQAIQKWEELKYPGYPLAGQDQEFFWRLQTKVFGDRIEKIAIQEAYRFLQINDVQTYRINPSCSQRGLFGYELIACNDGDRPDVDALFAWIESNRRYTYSLSRNYKYEFLQKDVHRSVMQMAPPIDDVRAYYYYCNGHFYDRGGPVPDYKMLFHEYRLQQDHTFHEFFANIYILAWWFYQNTNDDLQNPCLTKEYLAFLLAGDRLCELSMPIYMDRRSQRVVSCRRLLGYLQDELYQSIRVSVY